MPTIEITDGLDLKLETKPKFSSSITKYFKNPLSFRINDLGQLRHVSLVDAPVTSALVDLELEHDVEIGTDETEMTIGAGSSVGVRVFKKKDESVFPDRFGEGSGIKVRANRPYLAFSITPTLSSRFSQTSGELTFGFESGSSLSIANYKPFDVSAQGPSFVSALIETIQQFVLPGDVEDLKNMSPGTIVSVDGPSNLKFSAGFKVASIGNPLASIEAPDPVGEIKVKAGASVDVDASFSLKSDLQLRIHKLDENTIELGYYKKSGSVAEVEVAAQAGVSAGTEKKDLTTMLIGALSSEPKVDVVAFKSAGLSKERISDIDAAIKAGVNRRLELSLGVAFKALQEGTPAFLYKINLRELDANGRHMLHQALDGDLSGLVRTEGDSVRGVEPIRSITTTMKKDGVTIKVNLLGIYNFISIFDLVTKGVVQYEHETGELIFSDAATAKRIRAGVNNLAADSEKLHTLYAETFLFTAGYRGSTLASGGPKLDTIHTYFELQPRTNRETMKDNLDVPQALGLLKEGEKNRLLGASNQFGRSTLYAETGYDDEILGSLFVDDKGDPWPVETYENAGRKALSLLIEERESDSYRVRPLENDELWSKMKKAGSEGAQKELFDWKDVELKVIHSDYILIRWWAGAMRRMSEQLAATRKFLRANPNLDRENKEFKKVRSNLLKRIRGVAKTTESQFGDPWGLLAMDQLAQRRGRARVTITSDQGPWSRERKS